MPATDAGAAELLDLATRLAAAAAAVLCERPADLKAGAKTTATDAVTEMDRAAEGIILAGLAEARPDDAVVAEESGERPGRSGVRWYVDPLDGTVNYLYGLPQWAVSIAAEVDGEMVCGVVHDADGHVYRAARGAGATCDGVRLRCTTQRDPAMALVATGFGYAAALRAEQGRLVAALLPRCRDIRRMGSAALDLCAVAAGRVDAYYEAGAHPWDWAAGALIAREAGAEVGWLPGPLGTSVTLAANPALFASLRDLLGTLTRSPSGAGGVPPATS